MGVEILSSQNVDDLAEKIFAVLSQGPYSLVLFNRFHQAPKPRVIEQSQLRAEDGKSKPVRAVKMRPRSSIYIEDEHVSLEATEYGGKTWILIEPEKVTIFQVTPDAVPIVWMFTLLKNV